MPDGTAYRAVENYQSLSADEAERIIIGAILLDNSLLAQTSCLGVMDFSVPFYRDCFAAMLELAENDEPIDPILIYEIFKREEKTGWQIHSITNLTYGLPHFSEIRQYVQIVRETSVCIRAVNKAEKWTDNLASRKISLKEFCNSILSLESELREEFTDDVENFQPLSRIIQNEVLPTIEAYYKGKKSDFLISTGFPKIDEILGGGAYLSDFIAIVAPPKSAKSAFALQMAMEMARAGETVGLLSLEMSNLQNVLRLIAQESYRKSVEIEGNLDQAISANWIRPGMSNNVHQKASELSASLFIDNFLLCPKPLEWRELKAETKRLVKQKGLRVLIVDYWQLVENRRAGQSRADSLAEIAKGLKALAQGLNILVIALGQFNQEGLKKRANGEELSTLHLEGSGELAKSANIVLTIDIKDANLRDSSAPREGTMTFKPLRSAADAKLDCLFFGKYLTVEIV